MPTRVHALPAIVAVAICATSVVRAQDSDPAAEARALFLQLCKPKSDRSVLLEQIEDRGVAILPVLKKLLQDKVASIEAVEDVIGIGGGAGGRFGGRGVKRPPTRGPDPLPTYLPSGEFQLDTNPWWAQALVVSRSKIARADAGDLALEVLRRLGPKGAPCAGLVLRIAQADGEHYANPSVVRALRAMGADRTVLELLQKDLTHDATKKALAALGEPGVRTLCEHLRQHVRSPDDPPVNDHSGAVQASGVCRALLTSPSWPAGVRADALLAAAFDPRSRVRDAARAALLRHAVELRRQIRRWRAPEYVGKREERLATVLLGSALAPKDAFAVLRKVVLRRDESSRESRRVVYYAFARRAAEFARAELGPRVLALLDKVWPIAKTSVLESVGVLHALRQLRAEPALATTPVPRAVLEGFDSRLWQTRLAAVRAVQVGDRDQFDRLFKHTTDSSLDVALDSWAAIGRFRWPQDEFVARTDKVRERISRILRRFDTKKYTNRSGLVAIAALRATPCLEHAVGEEIFGIMREKLDPSAFTPRWWTDSMVRAAADLGPHATPLADVLLARPPRNLDRARALVTVVERAQTLEVLRASVTRNQLPQLIEWILERGDDTLVRETVPGLVRVSRAVYDRMIFDLVDHECFAPVHMRIVERTRPDLRERGLEALRRMGPKAKSVRGRVAKLLADEKSRERRLVLERLLATIDGE